MNYDKYKTLIKVFQQIANHMMGENYGFKPISTPVKYVADIYGIKASNDMYAISYADSNNVKHYILLAHDSGQMLRKFIVNNIDLESLDGRVEQTTVILMPNTTVISELADMDVLDLLMDICEVVVYGKTLSWRGSIESIKSDMIAGALIYTAFFGAFKCTETTKEMFCNWIESSSIGTTAHYHIDLSIDKCKAMAQIDRESFIDFKYIGDVDFTIS